MTTKVYVGNLPYSVDEDALHSAFDPQTLGTSGSITEVSVIKDKFSGRSKGFAFVTYDNAEAANVAIEKLNNADFGGRQIKVNIAKERTGGGGGGSRRGGGDRRDDRY